MENKLIVKDIQYNYQNTKILNNISFTCTNGVTAILGNNGAGKTTLMHIMTMLKTPLSGDIVLNNESMLNNNSIKDIIGYLPQNFDFYDNVTGYDFLSYICDLKKVDKKEKKDHILNIVETFNLNNVINKNIGKYSGGYKRRLGIAQAIIGNPQIVIIDEPTVGLDPEQRLEFRQYLSKIGKDKIVLISTHIIEDIELCGDKIIFIKNGTIAFAGSVNEAISKTTGKIFSAEIPTKDLAFVREKIHIIEEKRINESQIKIKFINNNTNNFDFENSILETEVSLENAYVYFQQEL
ncbi:ATP-binding cassette domain-containing protein [Clostridium gasigenes]|uniref:ATP-binding cassette domain-containing protein n=1 Tax=Clostridium gasigenes TaxID=94869 RepID=UPI001C0DD634|nr:ATP-binding cassette domain-containing protein [Clostridium gasigenes]MBU3134327.1 ATP-binding cassette domain-containing protein [Clostridium gasigenes]